MSRVRFSPVEAMPGEPPEETISDLQVRIQAFARRVDKELEKLSMVPVPGKGNVPLNKAVEGVLTRGAVVPWHLTWAASMMKQGWILCDGRAGTPKIHPAAGDSTAIKRFIRATAFGANSGGTGGADSHGHANTLKTPVLTHSGAISGGSHEHGGVTGAPSATTVVECAGEYPVASPTHTHGFTTYEAGHDHNADSISCHEAASVTGSVTAASTVSSYCELIFLMKT